MNKEKIMRVCKNCGSEIYKIEKVLEIESNEEFHLTNDSIYICLSCLETSNNLDDFTMEE